MTLDKHISCGECAADAEQPNGLARRDFMRLMGGGALWLAANGGAVPQVLAASQNPQPALVRGSRPAEALIRELYQGLSNTQRQSVVYPWNHGGQQIPTRHRMFNTAFGQRASQVYTAAQQEQVQRIVRAICADDEGFRRIATVIETDNWNRSSWRGVGANIFGNPMQGQFAFVLTAHHMTIRCDGNSEPNAAFGGPMYYGHLVDGYSQRNVFNYQTRSVRSVFDALTGAQRQQALVQGTPGELAQSIRFRPRTQRIPGLSSADLTSDQRLLVAAVMLAPYRREDADEVMDIVRRNGGLERIHLAFYRDRNATDNTRWNFWRLEGPGFVWNYRIQPHVHCYVNVAAVTT